MSMTNPRAGRRPGGRAGRGPSGRAGRRPAAPDRLGQVGPLDDQEPDGDGESSDEDSPADE